MQNGSLMRTRRLFGPDVWEFRWREPGPDGKRKHRRMTVGSVDELPDESAARNRISALNLEINHSDVRMKHKVLTISELVDHYRQREL
jgi:integrase